MIIPGLEKKLKGFKLDTKREWTPDTAIPTGKGSGPEKVYMRGKPTDHKALEVVLELDIVRKGRAGNKAIINYNSLKGWQRYRKLSDKYAKEIDETVYKFKNKNDRSIYSNSAQTARRMLWFKI